MTPDIINGLFELGGGAMLLLNVARLHRDKEVKGVRPLVVLFFAAWGLWNLFFYPFLGAWWSFAGGVFLVAVNFVWVVQLFYYLNKPARPEPCEFGHLEIV